MQNFLLNFLLLLFLCSCSTVEYYQDGNKTFLIGSTPRLARVIEKDGVCDFFFWGALPGTCSLNLQDEFFNLGVHDPALIKIGQKASFKSVLLTIVTFGLYLPVDYHLSLYSKNEER